MFFNSKRFEIVDLNNQTILELNKVNTLSFYVKDVLLDTTINSLNYQVIKKVGREETLVGTPTTITDITGDVAVFNYTPIDSTLTDITFRLHITDSANSEYVLYTDSYNIKL